MRLVSTSTSVVGVVAAASRLASHWWGTGSSYPAAGEYHVVKPHWYVLFSFSHCKYTDPRQPLAPRLLIAAICLMRYGHYRRNATLYYPRAWCARPPVRTLPADEVFVVCRW